MQSEDKQPKLLVPSSSPMEPSARVKQLANLATVEVDPAVPPKRYYRSGLEMVRMAEVYLKEHSYQKAYILYMKFMTLFLEKIRKHPQYNTVPPQVKAVNQAKLKEVMPIAEKLKQILLEQFAKEFKIYQEETEKRRIAEEKRRKQEQEDAKLAERLQADENKRDGTHSTPHLLDADKWALNPSAPPVDDVMYPDDFASQPRVPSNFHSTPPIIPPSRPVLGYLSCSGGLRRVVSSGNLPSQFLRLANQNTLRGVETCGVLAGLLERDQFKITHVIIPKQTGTPDSCSTNNEEDIFLYQDQHNLITLGWIHTHPTQTAFLSSVDLHTQCSYQLMMPEAIAIVCAPKYNETGYFALTPDYGVQFIASCRLTGFHPHPNDPALFHAVQHVHIDNSMSVEMVDLR